MGLKVGDIVRLKTGGPEMTVNRLKLADEMVETIWFADVGGPAFTDQFGVAALVKLDAPRSKEAA